MNFKVIINSSAGRIIISILLGLGFACLFHKVCKDKDCIEFAGPVISNIDGKIFQHDGKCYTYKAKAVKCDPSKKTVEFSLADKPGEGASSLVSTVTSSLQSTSFTPSFFTQI